MIAEEQPKRANYTTVQAASLYELLRKLEDKEQDGWTLYGSVTLTDGAYYALLIK